ncbi:helix-turn-helix transcriptional regulator [Bacteroidia bacterium]|nr:helix-turn-helix transcriptional regulator [Bacteroidia bacterium]
MGIRFLLKEIGFTGLQFEVRDKKELIRLFSDHTDATVVLDYTNFDFNNVEDLLIVGARFSKVNWILFSEELTLPFLKRIILEKTFSVLLKNSTGNEIRKALFLSRIRERYVCPRIVQFIETSKEKKESEVLTSTEKEILKLIAVGKSVREIAEDRISSVHTITTHKKNIFRKLEVNNIHEATKYALRSGLIDSMDYYI